MAWRDPRTTSGSWQVATDFPGLPAWLVKAVGGTTTHWAGACPRFKRPRVHARARPTATSTARACWTGRSRSRSSSPTTTRPRSRWASPIATAARRCPRTTTTRSSPTAPRSSATGTTRPGRTRPTPSPTTAARPASRTASTSRATRTARSGRRWSPSCRRPRRQATSTCGPTATSRRSSTTPRAGPPACSTSTATATLRRQRAARRLRGRQLDRDAAPAATRRVGRSTRTGWRTPPGQVGRNYMRHTTGTVWGQFDKPVKMWRGETMAGVIADESRLRHRPRLRRRLLHGDDLPRAAPSSRSSSRRAHGAPELTELLDGYTQHRRHVDHRRGHAARGQTASRCPAARSTSTGYRWPNVHFDDHPNDVAMRRHGLAPGRRGLQRRRAPTGTHRDAALPVDAQPRAPAA